MAKRQSLKSFIREQRSRRPSLDEMKQCWSEVMSEFGYLVIGTKPGVEPFALGETVTDLWEYPVGQPFRVIAYTDQHEYDTHIAMMQSLRPAWPKIATASHFGEGGKFYRVSTSEDYKRAQFEKWASSELAKWLSPYSTDLEEYMGEIMQAAWMAWQESDRAAFAAGQAEMRERAAKAQESLCICEDEAEISTAIRALPVTGEKKSDGREQGRGKG